MKKMQKTAVALLIAAALSGTGVWRARAAEPLPADAAQAQSTAIDLSVRCDDIGRRVAQLAPVEMKVDTSFLTRNQKRAVKKLVEAARLMDNIFFNQTYHLNEAWREALRAAKDLDPAYLAYFEIMDGPFDRIDNDRPFIGTMTKPETTNLYPVDMTKAEFEAWLKAHPEDEKSFKGTFTVIARRDGKLVAIPYSEAYKTWLEPAAHLLREAAVLCGNASLKKFLTSRAGAFLSNEYFPSDIDWMDVSDSPIDVTIGPYEVYDDKLFGYKAAFEAYVTVVNPEESRKLQVYQKYLRELDANLPMPAGAKWLRDTYESPIRVVDVLATGGEARGGVQTLAFNLPNDERVRQVKGNKQVLLKNIMTAKFEGILRPIAAEVLSEADVKQLSAEAFFLSVLQHEIGHSLGPSTAMVGGKAEDVGKALKERYSAIEEAKADTLSMLNTLYLLDKGEVAKELEPTLLPTYLAGLFRTIRFGLEEAHGTGVMIQFNFLAEKGAIGYDAKTGKFVAHGDNIRAHFRELARILLEIQANGDYEAAGALIAKYGTPTPEVREVLTHLTHVPVDIRPVYPAID
ncbi:MAG TPA: peptidase [Candidatus Ozemobacteraceae bacterium]